MKFVVMTKDELQNLKEIKEFMKMEVLFRSAQWSGVQTKSLHYLISTPKYKEFLKVLQMSSALDKMINTRENSERRRYNNGSFWNERKG